MEIYLVGGAVRDRLLGLPVNERDWVVVGATLEEMLQQGYQPVGKDFPVFLHPETKEEYALARTERKTSKGYKGFKIYAAPDVTLEEDLKRRDLTINAIAEDKNGNIIDPFHGQQDLHDKILRHVSPAFAEDPLRILRVARFAAKLPDFTLDPQTLQFMQDIVYAGEVEALTPERVFKEIERALNEKAPQRFFEILQACGAFSHLFPMLKNIDVKHLRDSEAFSAPAKLALALSSNDLTATQKLISTYRLPNDYADLLKLTITQLASLKNLDAQDPQQLLQFILQTDALRRRERFQQLLNILKQLQPDQAPTLAKLEQALEIIRNVDHAPLIDQGLSGQDFARALQKMRIVALSTL